MPDKQADLEKAIRVTKIEVNSEEQKVLGKELEVFSKWLEPLLEVNTVDVEPVLFGHGGNNVLREDQPQAGELEDLHKAAPAFEDGFYKVPPIIE